MDTDLYRFNGSYSTSTPDGFEGMEMEAFWHRIIEALSGSWPIKGTTRSDFQEVFTSTLGRIVKYHGLPFINGHEMESLDDLDLELLEENTWQTLAKKI